MDSKGIELEVVGRLGQNVDLVLGYTPLQLEGAQGQDIYEWVPRHTANIALSARVPSFTAAVIRHQRPVAKRYVQAG